MILEILCCLAFLKEKCLKHRLVLTTSWSLYGNVWNVWCWQKDPRWVMLEWRLHARKFHRSQNNTYAITTPLILPLTSRWCWLWASYLTAVDITDLSWRVRSETSKCVQLQINNCKIKQSVEVGNNASQTSDTYLISCFYLAPHPPPYVPTSLRVVAALIPLAQHRRDRCDFAEHRIHLGQLLIHVLLLMESSILSYCCFLYKYLL